MACLNVGLLGCKEQACSTCQESTGLCDSKHVEGVRGPTRHPLEKALQLPWFSGSANTLIYQASKPVLPALENLNHSPSLNATVMNFIRMEGKKKEKNQNPEGEAATRVHPNFPVVLFALRSFGKSRQKHLLHFVSEDLVTH